MPTDFAAPMGSMAATSTFQPKSHGSILLFQFLAGGKNISESIALLSVPSVRDEIVILSPNLLAERPWILISYNSLCGRLASGLKVNSTEAEIKLRKSSRFTFLSENRTAQTLRGERFSNWLTQICKSNLSSPCTTSHID